MILSDFTQWLANHSALINLTTSVILATATIVYVVFTIRLVNETRKAREQALDLNKKALEQEIENIQLESIYTLIREAFHELGEYEWGTKKGTSAIYKFAKTELGKLIANPDKNLDLDPKIDYLNERAEPVKILIEYIDGNFNKQKVLLDRILKTHLVKYHAKFEFIISRIHEIKKNKLVKDTDGIRRLEKLKTISTVITSKYKSI